MSTPETPIRYRFGGFELQPDQRQLVAGDTPIHLGPHAFDLLTVLAGERGGLVTKDELLRRVWGRVVVEENTLQAHISALRKVLGRDAIATVSGRGYRFALEVTSFQARGATPAAPRHNLPHQLSSFIGREREIAELTRLLGSARLITLIGTGGCGKTRLAIELAGKQAHAYGDGVWLIELAALSDPALLVQTVADVLGIQEKTGAKPLDTLVQFLATRSVLLVLDNAEHLIDACAQLSEGLLQRCPRLVILATSREPLRVTGEQNYRVPSLSLPREADTSPDVIAGHESARLFIERARLQQANFSIDAGNCLAISSICRRLDGIALALELAAPRLRVLPVEELSRRLDQRFELLTEGSRTALPRHRTLRALVDWSYDALADEEKSMLRRLSVFSGGWTLEAAKQLLNPEEAGYTDPLRTLTSLTDKNLVVARERDGTARYSMLETIREYANDRLRETDEHAQVRNRHLAMFAALAEEAHSKKTGDTAPAWLDRLDTEIDNFRAALSWWLEAGADDAGARLANALCWFWLARGHITEGRRWMADVLTRTDSGSFAAARAYVARSASLMAQRQGDLVEAQRLSEEALALWTGLGNTRGIAASWQTLGMVAYSKGDYAAARRGYEQALELFREMDAMDWVGTVLSNLGETACAQGCYDDACARLQESLDLARRTRSVRVPHILTSLGTAVHCQGNSERARAILTEAVAGWRALGDRDGIAYALVSLAEVIHDVGDDVGVWPLLHEVLSIECEIGNPQLVITTLTLTGEVLLRGRKPLAALRLWGQAEHLCTKYGSDMTPLRRAHYELCLARARAELGDAMFQQTWNEGRTCGMNQAMEDALELVAQRAHATDHGNRR